MLKYLQKNVYIHYNIRLKDLIIVDFTLLIRILAEIDLKNRTVINVKLTLIILTVVCFIMKQLPFSFYFENKYKKVMFVSIKYTQRFL